MPVELVNTIPISGIITKWLYQAPSLQIVLIRSGQEQEYKVLDFDLLLEGARVGDFCELTANLAKDDKEKANYFQMKNTGNLNNDSWKIVDLKEFNRPFTSQQIYNLINEIPRIGSKTVEKIANYINLTELAKLIQAQNWATIKTKLLESSIAIEHLVQLVKQFQQFERETRNFSHLIVTNMLIKYKKCQLDEHKWKKCRKIIRRLIESGQTQQDIIYYIESDPYKLILEDLIKATNKNFEIIDSIAHYGPYEIIHKRWLLKDKSRQLAGIWTTLLNSLHENQDCYLPLNTLMQNSKQLLQVIVPKIERELTKATMYQLQNGEGGKGPKTIVFPSFIDAREKAVVCQLAHYRFVRSFTVSEEELLELDPELDPNQIKVIIKITNDGWGIITGPPGVGKTRLISAITGVLACRGEKIILSAPTGLACKNIAKNVPEDNSVYTIAKLLYGSKDDGYEQDEEFDIHANDSDNDELFLDNEKTANIDEIANMEDEKIVSREEQYSCLLEKLVTDHHGIIIDEASMLDLNQIYRLLQFFPKVNFRIILVGDPNQLPSIGPGQVLTDLIRGDIIPYHHLTVNYRQRQGSQIIANAVKIVEGNTDLIPGPDFKTVQTGSDQETVDLLNQLIEHLKDKGQEHLDNTVILSPYSKKGFLASNNLNRMVKPYFNPNPIQSWGNFSIGDRVMQTKNVPKKQIVNGDIGHILELKFKAKGQVLQYLVVEYAINKYKTVRIRYTPSEVRDQVSLAYVISIHKSQGNGYQSVLILIPQHYNYGFFNRNMLYTAVTRAKQSIYLIGGDCHSAIRNKIKIRNTRLWARLKKIRQPFNKSSNCSICDELCADKKVLRCQHEFCQTCLLDWLKQHNNCPICRTDIIPQIAISSN